MIPVEASGASDWASETTVRQIQEPRCYKEGLRAAFLVSRCIPRTVLGRAIREHVAEHGLPLLATAISNRIAFTESLTMGQTIFEWAPPSAAAWEIAALMDEIGDAYEEKLLKAEA